MEEKNGENRVEDEAGSSSGDSFDPFGGGGRSSGGGGGSGSGSGSDEVDEAKKWEEWRQWLYTPPYGHYCLTP